MSALKKILAIAVLLVVVLVGGPLQPECSDPEVNALPPEEGFNVTFSPEIRDHSLEAIRTWERVLDDKIVNSSSSHNIKISFTSFDDNSTTVGEAYWTLDDFTVHDCWIEISEKTTLVPNMTINVITHEIGHCLGLGHHHDHNSCGVMAEDYGSQGEERWFPSQKEEKTVRLLWRIASAIG